MTSSSGSNVHLRLGWHNHNADLMDVARDLFDQSELTDVTLCCAGGVTFNAHRMVLAGASSIFRTMFHSVNVWKHPVIFLKDVDASDMEYFLQFIYFGEVNVPEKELDNLIRVARELGIKGLDDSREPLATTTVSDDTFSSFTRNFAAKRLPPRVKRKASLHAESLLKRVKIKQEEMDEESSRVSRRRQPSEDDGDSNDPLGNDDDDDDFQPEEKKCKPPKEPKPLEGFTGEDIGDNMVEVLESCRGQPMIGMNGFKYMKSREKDSRITWRCTHRNCKGRVVTDVHCLHGEMGHGHSHPPNTLHVEKQKVMNRLKHRAVVSMQGPSAIVDEVLSEVSEELRAVLPKRDSLVRLVRNKTRIVSKLCAIEMDKEDREEMERRQRVEEEEEDAPEQIIVEPTTTAS